MLEFDWDSESYDPANTTLPRERLFSILDHSKQALLIGVFADNGFGKTTLVKSFLASQKKRAVWYTLNSIDHFGENILPNLKKRLIQFDLPVDIHNDGYDDIISAFCALNEPLWIVFDNYHFVNENSILVALIRDILALEIENVKIVLIGKNKPYSSTTKLKSKRQYIELNSSDLSFTKEETYSFFNEYHQLNLSKVELEIIYEKTAGWPAGYQLILDYLLKKKNAKSDLIGLDLFADIPDMFEYLSNEVFDTEPAEVQDFLMKTSLMPDLDPDIIDPFLDIRNSAEIINYLVRHHVFIEKNEFGFYQYHRLFRQFLYDRYFKADPETVYADNRKLSAILRKKYHFIDAFAHAVASNDYYLAAELMSIIVSRYEPIQFVNVIDGELEEFSLSLLFTDTTVFLTRCIPEIALRKLITPLQDSVAQAEKEQSILKLANLQHRLATIYYHCGDIAKSHDYTKASLENATLLQDHSLMAFDLQLLAACYNDMKQYDKGMQHARQALFLTEKYDIRSMQIHTLEALASLSLSRQEYQQAESYITQALDITSPESYMIFWLYVLKSRLLLIQQDPEALVWAEKAINCLSRHGCDYDKAYTYNNLGYLYLSTDQPELAEKNLDIAYENSTYCLLLRYYIVENQIKLYQSTGDAEKEAQKRQELADICHIQGYDWLMPKAAAPSKAAVKDTDILEIHTLGTFSITTGDGDAISLKRSSSLRLFQFLLSKRHRSVNRSMITDQIFPEDASDHSNHFNVALSVLRKSLEPGIKSGKDSRFIIRTGDRYQLNMDRIHLDADTFSSLCANQSSIVSESLIAQMLQAEALYQGDFMEEYPYEPYLEDERTALRVQYMDILYAIAVYFCEHDEPLKSIAYYEKILAKDPYQEDIYLECCDVLLSIKAVSQAKSVANRMITNVEETLGIPCTAQLTKLFLKYQIVYPS